MHAATRISSVRRYAPSICNSAHPRIAPFTSHGAAPCTQTADYRVVYSPAVAIRDKPWGNVVGSRNAGDLVPTTHRSVGLPDGVWVKTKQSYAHKDGTSAPGWMLIDGNAISLGTLLEKVERGRSGIIKRYRVAVDRCDIRERPSLAGTPVVGTRKRGEVLRTDQDLNGWVRVQADFYQTGKAEPYEGWTLIDGRREMGIGPILHLWEPANVPAAAIGFALQGGQTRRNWILVAEGAAVRERPWGRVLCTWNRGRLLRCDCEKDGWARIEADFTEDGPLSPEDVDDEPALLEGWVLMDGRCVHARTRTHARSPAHTHSSWSPTRRARCTAVR